ncbi:MAG: type I-E CRISPR-associated endoribonuclease Cas2e [Thermoanaerobaculia bacterium]|nr:type I-E CRISPR-associated endoribonuclease Cas2e [Thermoanaerobaculia bacterium]
MTVLVVEKASPSLRGLLTRWMLEIRAGVFVGSLSARVRDKLWEHLTKHPGLGGCVLLHPALTEQGFQVRIHGDTTRQIVDIEGLQLVLRR